ncbi:PREDICTED: GDP-D-glucose phosphorylase 1 [Papilio xuthus]|uniref:GDP-D-glucose phosphorylase 1 n=1 Tax=Papilio xuthus TaxID=66420 RepID=A0AAJ6ZF81_PAPXU|nr:PREDICTED: GDP-D-glucose phosphorylase 1 [Papilio xuthus]XP_013171441.1 PREDICTED: GDP-D-glucose phosphorylase 1 [Papilio xuthus]
MSIPVIKLGRNINTDFLHLYKSTWDKIHVVKDVFRYKVENLRERIVNEKYLLQLNPDRSMNRRIPEQIDNICQPFDENKFNFTKASKEETMFIIVSDDNDVDKHVVLVNVSPISHYHSLLCPSMYKCLPQILTKDSLQLVLRIMLCVPNSNIRIGFNSLCGLASVNHLHYHIFVEKNILPVETVKCKHLKGPVYILDDYPVPGFCFEVTQQINDPSDYIYKLIDVLLKKAIAHNIFITRGQSVVGDSDVVRVIVWPRKSSSGAKQLAAFNVAVCELSGWFPVYDAESFEKLTTEELEDELRKWKYNRFHDLCEDIKQLY